MNMNIDDTTNEYFRRGIKLFSERKTEKGQESESNDWDIHEQEDCVAEHSYRLFKGSVERFFAFYNMKPDH